MIPWTCLDPSESPAGGGLSLWQRGHEYAIRLDNQILMTSALHGSEERLATLACQGLRRGRVLVGGLGMGYTLRAALDVVGPQVEVVVAEMSPQIVAWNRGVLGALAGSPLRDRRVRLEITDVARLFDRRAAWDAVMLDTDNGPEAMSGGINQGLYSLGTLAKMQQALTPEGRLAIWSASDAPAFEKQLRLAGFTCKRHPVPAREKRRGGTHTIFVACSGARTRREGGR